MSTFVINVLVSSVIPVDLNYTFLALIPKCEGPTTLDDRCHISLCNVLYKIISKVLVNRLKPLMGAIIYEC